MVSCCILYCSSNQKTNFNERNIQLFRFPVGKNLEKTEIRKGKEDGFYHKKNKKLKQKPKIITK